MLKAQGHLPFESREGMGMVIAMTDEIKQAIHEKARRLRVTPQHLVEYILLTTLTGEADRPIRDLEEDG
jgi:hypothetical protein